MTWRACEPKARGRWRVVAVIGSVGLVALALPSAAHACLGFYVSASGAELASEAARVVVMRDGDETVLSVQPGAGGAAEAFVLPVPSGVRAADVQVLSRQVFARVEALSAPRLAEYWEQDPCSAERPASAPRTIGGGGGGASDPAAHPLVTVDARLTAGEYEIVILRGRDAAALAAWLGREGYRVPAGAPAALRPYLDARASFLVARMDPRRDRARSPLRIRYRSPELVLPLRLGHLGGSPELVVHVLARERYEAANRPNAIAPTDLAVTPSARERFHALYAAVFERFVERNPGAVITEYARPADACEPCAARHGLSGRDLAALGADVVFPNTPPAPGAQVREVRAEPPRVRGPLSVAEIERVTRQHLAEVRFCYQEAPTESAGRVSLRLTVDASGDTTSVARGRTTLRNPELEECIVRAARRWTLPPSSGPSVIDAAFVLSSTSIAEDRRTRAWREWERWAPLASELVLTRLRYRAAGEEADDLVLRPARPIEGGVGAAIRPGSRAAQSNAFQARFAIEHPWRGPAPCGSPMRGVWGEGPSPSPVIASTLDPNPTTAELDLSAFFLHGVPALGIERDVSEPAPVTPPAAPRAAPTAADGGCAIAPRASSGAPAGLLLGAIILLNRRRGLARAAAGRRAARRRDDSARAHAGAGDRRSRGAEDAPTPVIRRTRAARSTACGPR